MAAKNTSSNSKKTNTPSNADGGQALATTTKPKSRKGAQPVADVVKIHPNNKNTKKTSSEKAKTLAKNHCDTSSGQTINTEKRQKTLATQKVN